MSAIFRFASNMEGRDLLLSVSQYACEVFDLHHPQSWTYYFGKPEIYQDKRFRREHEVLVSGETWCFDVLQIPFGNSIIVFQRNKATDLAFLTPIPPIR